MGIQSICSLLLLSACFNSLAQVNRFRHLSVENGLSQSTVYSIVQDEQGYMWFATMDGLNRYDGYNIRIFKHQPDNPDAIPDNYINVLFNDSKGNLWAGLHNAGLCLYLKEKESFVHFNSTGEPGKPLSGIISIGEDPEGHIYAGTEDGLYILNRKTKTFEQIIQCRTNTIIPAAKGKLWIGCDKGLLYMNKQGSIDTLSQAAVTCVFEESDTSVWFGTDNGMFRLNKSTGVFSMHIPNKNGKLSLVNNQVNCLMEDKAGNLWVGTEGGISKFNLKHQTFSNFTNIPSDPMSLSSNIVYNIYKDRSGVVWIGTSLGGVNTWSLFDNRFQTFRQNPVNKASLSSNRIRSIYRDSKGTLWIGTVDGGLNRKKGNCFIHYLHDTEDNSSISGNHIRALLEDRQGNFWIGTDGGGLDRMNRITGTFVHFRHDPGNPESISDDHVWAVTQDSRGRIWVATFGGGLNFFDRETGVFKTFRHSAALEESISDDKVTSVYEDHTGTLWAGTFGGGLNRWNEEQQRFEHFKHNDLQKGSISNDRIYSITEDAEGELWIGTKGGLNHYIRKDGSFETYLVQDGLPNDVVMGILDDGYGSLWISTNAGIARFDKHKKIFRNYDINDGLQSNEFLVGAYFKDAEGALYFGGINGYNVFHPAFISDNDYRPEALITAIDVLGIKMHADTALSLKHAITLTHKDRNFCFEYLAISYVHPEKNSYAYRMQGFDKNWNYVGNRRFASYTNLPPGRYTFMVKAANNDGLWSNHTAKIAVTIMPAFWQTAWFKALMTILVLASVYLFYRIRIRNIKRQNKKLEEEVRNRTAEVVKQRDEIEVKNKLIEASFKEIRDSIRYAQRIQTAILPPDNYVKKLLPDAFLLYIPKDIVSGDFYWITERNGKVFFAAVDCTGHGVPGAFMSIVGNNQLNYAVNVMKANTPARILSALSEGVSRTLRQKDAHPDVKDGMDIALCAIDKSNMTLEYAGAYNPLYIIRKGIADNYQAGSDRIRFFGRDMMEVKADKNPIGGLSLGGKQGYSNFEFKLQQGDALYLFSDGYSDQFGGANGKKFKYRQLKEKLLSICHLPPTEQKKELLSSFETWKGELEQVDDICIIGVCI